MKFLAAEEFASQTTCQLKPLGSRVRFFLCSQGWRTLLKAHTTVCTVLDAQVSPCCCKQREEKGDVSYQKGVHLVCVFHLCQLPGAHSTW